MDGAMRFVRGDAIAGLLITAVNLVAGVALGTTSHGMSAAQALTTYGVLTIGDGLAAQIPAVFVSVAAAFAVLLIDDPRSPSSLPGSIAREFGRTPAHVVGAGALLIALGLVPGMPAIAFVTTGAGTALVGWLLSRRPTVDDRAPVQLGAAPRLEVRVGQDLSRCLGGPERVSWLADEAARSAADAVRWPPPAVVHPSTAATGPDSWHLDLDGAPAASGVLDPSTPIATADAFAADLRGAVAGLLPELADVQTTADLLDALAETHPALAREALAGPLSLPTLTRLLSSLMADGLAAGDLRTVLDAVLSVPGSRASRPDFEETAEAIRPRFQRQITALALEGRASDVVEAFTLDENLLFGFEDLVTPTGRAASGGPARRLIREAPPTLRRDVQQAALKSLGRSTLPRPILFTPPPIRRLVRDALGARWQHVVVLCAGDLDPAVAVEPAGALTIPSDPTEAI
jgi:flagellar biosynthesis component FlhA